jgi:hypothetical protein
MPLLGWVKAVPITDSRPSSCVGQTQAACQCKPTSTTCCQCRHCSWSLRAACCLLGLLLSGCGYPQGAARTTPGCSALASALPAPGELGRNSKTVRQMA